MPNNKKTVGKTTKKIKFKYNIEDYLSWLIKKFNKELQKPKIKFDKGTGLPIKRPLIYRSALLVLKEFEDECIKEYKGE